MAKFESLDDIRADIAKIFEDERMILLESPDKEGQHKVIRPVFETVVAKVSDGARSISGLRIGDEAGVPEDLQNHVLTALGWMSGYPDLLKMKVATVDENGESEEPDRGLIRLIPDLLAGKEIEYKGRNLVAGDITLWWEPTPFLITLIQGDEG